MKIIILGAGRVGYSLAKHFSLLEHRVTVIDQDPQICEDINSKLDASAITSVGSAPVALEEAGIASADMLIAVTPSDEVNLLACHFAKQNGVQKRIARVKTNAYTTMDSCISLEELGVTHLLEPEREVVKRILQYVELPGVIETANFQSNTIYLRGYQVTEDMPIANKTLAEIKRMADPASILFVIVMRGDKSVPANGSQVIMPGDKVVAMMPVVSFDVFRTLINRKFEKLSKVVVSGDSLTAIHLAQALKPLCERVIVLDPSEEHGRTAAAMLNNIEVLYGDGTNSEVLQEVNVGNADYFISVGEDTEDNIMSCLLAKSEGAGRVVAIRNSDRYDKLFSSLGIDRLIRPQRVMVNSIIEMVQTISLGPYLKLDTFDIEVIHVKASAKSRIVGKSLRELVGMFKKSVIIGCIIRERSALVPDGSTVIEAGDEAIVLCSKEDIRSVIRRFN